MLNLVDHKRMMFVFYDDERKDYLIALRYHKNLDEFINSYSISLITETKHDGFYFLRVDNIRKVKSIKDNYLFYLRQREKKRGSNAKIMAQRILNIYKDALEKLKNVNEDR